MREIKIQKGEMWTDKDNNLIPMNRITNIEKFHEASTGKIVRMAMDIEEEMKALKALISVMVTRTADLNGINDKENYTVYNFDHSVKIVRDTVVTINYDDELMKEAFKALSAYISSRVTMENEMKEFILGAFKTRKGKFDSRKIQDILLLRQQEGFKDDDDFGKAIEVLLRAKTEGEKKTYDRIYIWDSEKKDYDQVILNFSGV